VHVNGHTQIVWTKEREDRLRVLWTEGVQSSAQIAKELGGGISRNAVLGKAHRMGIANDRPKAISKNHLSRAQMRKQRERAPSAFHTSLPFGAPEKFSTAIKDASTEYVEKIQPDDTAIPLTQRKSLIDLEPHDCRWPVGDPLSDDFFFAAPSANRASRTASTTSGGPTPCLR
jgi:GcrA cell cycle regulator